MKLNLKERKKQAKGITLIALVITIIVLLILAGISIAMLTGENGILTQANNAKEKTEIAEVKERAQTDIVGEQAGNNGELTKSKFIEILNRYFKDVPTEEEFPEDLTTLTLETKEEYGSHNIQISEIYNVEFAKEKEYIETATSYVGYYADIDGNGTVDGIIYVDLAVGGSGKWYDEDYKDWSNYEYSAVTEGLKNYYVIQREYEGVFGTKDVLTPDGSGQDRFYIMALKDVNPGTTYCWYDAKSGSYEEGWGVPSMQKWSAFGDYLYRKCGIPKSNHSDYGLSTYYWSSIAIDTEYAFIANFDSGYFNWTSVNNNYSVRLSTTF